MVEQCLEQQAPCSNQEATASSILRTEQTEVTDVGLRGYKELLPPDNLLCEIIVLLFIPETTVTIQRRKKSHLLLAEKKKILN